MLTVWVPAKRSARFYGQYVGQKDQTYQKFQKKFSHQASPPFTGKWPTAVLQQRLFLTPSGALHSIAQDDELCLSNATKTPRACLDKPGRGGIMKRRKGVAASGWPIKKYQPFLADRLDTSQAVSTLLWSVCRSTRPDTPRTSKGISSPSLTSLHREVANRRFAATPLSDPLRGGTQYSTG